MAISTYAELQAAVANWLSRSDLAERIPEFIALAESDIARDVRARVMEVRVSSIVSSQYTDLPSDLLELRNIQLNTDPVRRLRFRTPEQLDAIQGIGVPTAYSLIGNELQLAPTPDGSYEAELAYYARPAALSADNPSNILLGSYPGLYLYGALACSAPFMHDDARLATWGSLYEREVATLNDTDQRARYSGSALTVRSDGGNP